VKLKQSFINLINNMYDEEERIQSNANQLITLCSFYGGQYLLSTIALRQKIKEAMLSF